MPTVAPTETPAPAVPTPAPVAPPAATPVPVPQVVPVVKERDVKAPKHKRVVHHKKAPKKVAAKPVVLAAQVAATPAGGVQAGEGGTAPDDGGLPLGLIGGGFLFVLAGGAAVRAGVSH